MKELPKRKVLSPNSQKALYQEGLLKTELSGCPKPLLKGPRGFRIQYQKIYLPLLNLSAKTHVLPKGNRYCGCQSSISDLFFFLPGAPLEPSLPIESSSHDPSLAHKPPDSGEEKSHLVPYFYRINALAITQHLFLHSPPPKHSYNTSLLIFYFSFYPLPFMNFSLVFGGYEHRVIEFCLSHICASRHRKIIFIPYCLRLKCFSTRNGFPKYHSGYRPLPHVPALFPSLFCGGLPHTSSLPRGL